MNHLNPPRQRFARLFASLCAAVATLLPSGHAAVTNSTTNATTTAAAPIDAAAIVAARKSVFEDKLQFRDPFFPSSKRRQPAVVTSANPDVPAPKPVVELVLKGISKSANRKFALINDQTFEVGEENQVKTPAGLVKVKCLEILDESAVISVGPEGERRELRLQQGL